MAFTGTEQQVQAAAQLLDAYYRLGPGPHEDSATGENFDRTLETKYGMGVGDASKLLNAYAMNGGDTSWFPSSIPGLISSPEYAQHIAAGRGPGLRDWLQIAGIVAGPLLAAGSGTAAGAGAAEGAAAGGAAGGTGITAGAAGQTGLTAGTVTGGIGGGALGSGLTAGGSAGTGAAAGAGALGAGYFGSETAYPVAGGQTAAASGSGVTTGTSGGGTTATTAAKQTALSKILAGTATQDDYLTLFGQVAPSLLGMYGADRQADALGAQAARYEAMGAPYRDRLGELYSDPTAFLNSPEVKVPVQMGTDALARALSTQGNPAGSGNALQQLQSYSTNQLFGRLGQEKDRLAGFGGLTAYNSAAPSAATNAIGAERGFYDALGYGAGQVLNPPRSLEEILKQYNISQGLA